jgi:hypothetical protein
MTNTTTKRRGRAILWSAAALRPSTNSGLEVRDGALRYGLRRSSASAIRD